MRSNILATLFLRTTTLFLVVALLGNGVTTGFAQSAYARKAARAKRAQEMENKLAALRKEFKQLGSRLQDVSDQAGANARAEWRVARRDIERMDAELQAEYEDAVGELSQSMSASWKDFEKGKAEAAKDIATTRAEWGAWSARMKNQHHARVKQLRAEINDLDKQAKQASSERRGKYIAARAEVRKQYEADVKEMQASYQNYIDSLDAEMARIDKNVDKANAEMNSALTKQSENISQQMHAAYEELQSSYQDVAAKANSYVASTKAWLKDSTASAKEVATAELDDVAHTARQMQAEMVATCKAQCDSLEQEVASLKSRATKATGETKAKLNAMAEKLEAKHQAAKKRYELAHDAYVTDLNRHIDDMRTNVVKADERNRQRMIRAIEIRQTQLEQAKKKLKSRG